MFAVADEDRLVGGSGGPFAGRVIALGNKESRAPGDPEGVLESLLGFEKEGDWLNCDTDARFGMTIPPLGFNSDGGA